MRVFLFFLGVVCLLAGSLATASGELKSNGSLEFELTLGSDNGRLRVPDTKYAQTRFTVVCFLGTECPLAKLYAARLSELSLKYEKVGVRFVGVISNVQDSQEDIARYIESHQIPFPVAKDEGQAVADSYGAVRTPEVFLLNDKLRIVYRGRIDNQYQPGIARDKPTQRDLERALDEALAGKPISTPRADAIGCRIGRIQKTVAGTTVTYASHIAEILHKNCVECHRTGEIAPFSLDNYDELVGWGPAILESVDEGRMPPWHANPQHGSFSNARSMSAQDKMLLTNWIRSGSPLGDADKVPRFSNFKAPIGLQSPDIVVDMRDKPYRVPATGTVEYQYFVVDPQFAEDRWVSGVEILPGNRAVVHHAIVFIRPPDGGRFRGVGWLGAYVPGQRVIEFPSGHARLVPARSKLVFQMHYTPNGTEQTDLTRVAMKFQEQAKVTHEIYTLAALDQEFEIPPGTADHPVSGQLDRLPANGSLLAIAPHMHYRGKSFQIQVHSPGGERILLDVPRYDFNWQHSYILSQPLQLSTIDKVTFRATFDNSPENPFNPDASQYVTWGDQTWEEMAIAFFEVAEPRTPQSDASKYVRSRNDSGQDRRPEQVAATGGEVVEPQNEESRNKVQAFVADFFEQLDKNLDGRLERLESPLAFRYRSFSLYDADNNGIVTRDEVEKVAQRVQGL